MAKLVPMQKYWLTIPDGRGGPAAKAHVVTYTGAYEYDVKCAICGAQPQRRDHTRHFFVEGDPDNPKWQWAIGTECIKKCKITPESATEDRMGTMKDVFGRIEESELSEAKFPSAGKGMEWGEYEQVTPENLAGYVERLKADKGMFVIATYTRMTWFDAKMWAKWEAVGKPMIRVAKDGKGLYSLEGKNYVFSPSTSPSVKWVPNQPESKE